MRVLVNISSLKRLTANVRPNFGGWTYKGFTLYSSPSWRICYLHGFSDLPSIGPSELGKENQALPPEDQGFVNEKIVHSCGFTRWNSSGSSRFACNYLGCTHWRICLLCSMTLTVTWMIAWHVNPKHIFILSSSILLSRVQGVSFLLCAAVIELFCC